MSAAGQFVAVATAEIGYLEKSRESWELYGVSCLYHKTEDAGAGNVQRYSYETGHYRLYGWAPWCMSFVCWCLVACFGADSANKLLCGMYKSASTMETRAVMAKAGREVPLAKAEPGDLVFRSRTGGGHVGIVAGWQDGKLVTVEGNTSATDATAWNGGAVAQHIGGQWQWCMRPDWSIVDSSGGWHWVHDGGTWYYQDSTGKNAHGWQKIKETNGNLVHWYYFADNGAMQTGLLRQDGKIYYLAEEGPLEGACCRTNSTGALEIWSI